MSKQTDNEENRWLHYNEFVFYRGWFLPFFFSHISLSFVFSPSQSIQCAYSPLFHFIEHSLHAYIYIHVESDVYRQNWYAIFIFLYARVSLVYFRKQYKECLCSLSNVWKQKHPSRKGVLFPNSISQRSICIEEKACFAKNRGNHANVPMMNACSFFD